MSEKRYNVYIVEIATGRAASLIGSNLTDSRVESRVNMGISRTDLDVAFVTSVEAGCSKDLEFASHLGGNN